MDIGASWQTRPGDDQQRAGVGGVRGEVLALPGVAWAWMLKSF
jgi:hypothetical protein